MIIMTLYVHNTEQVLTPGIFLNKEFNSFLNEHGLEDTNNIIFHFPKIILS